MKKHLLTFLFFLISYTALPQCLAPDSISTSNINYYNVDVNWSSSSGAYYYRIRYKIASNSAWLYVNGIDSSLNTKTLVNLTPLVNYVWQIKAYCDTLNLNTSNWSNTDTFTTITNNCPNTNITYTTNTTHNNALANWAGVSGAHRYKVRYKNVGNGTWSNLAPVFPPANNITIPLLLASTSYEWQIKTYHDSTVLQGSLWSISDTFTTTQFVAAPFNPMVFNTLTSLECNAQTGLKVRITQTENEPDIGSGTIVSDGGYFNLSSINSGDSVGYAIMTTATQNINTVLRAGIVLGQNYAVINSYDSTGSIVGFFTIENSNNGIKLEVPGSPNDGNNYTSGYVSEILFTNLFVNPANEGPLHFFADITSELNDQSSASDTVQIWCITSTSIEHHPQSQTNQIFDVLGRKSLFLPNTLQIIKFSDGKIKKQMSVEKK